MQRLCSGIQFSRLQTMHLYQFSLFIICSLQILNSFNSKADAMKSEESPGIYKPLISSIEITENRDDYNENSISDELVYAEKIYGTVIHQKENVTTSIKVLKPEKDNQQQNMNPIHHFIKKDSVSTDQNNRSEHNESKHNSNESDEDSKHYRIKRQTSVKARKRRNAKGKAKDWVQKTVVVKSSGSHGPSGPKYSKVEEYTFQQSSNSPNFSSTYTIQSSNGAVNSFMPGWGNPASALTPPNLQGGLKPNQVPSLLQGGNQMNTGNLLNPNPLHQNPMHPNLLNPNPLNQNPLNPNPLHQNPLNPNPLNQNPLHPNPLGLFKTNYPNVGNLRHPYHVSRNPRRTIRNLDSDPFYPPLRLFKVRRGRQRGNHHHHHYHY